MYISYNLVSFTLIFSLFGLIIYTQISNSLFSRIDSDLRQAKEAISMMSDFVDIQIDLRVFDRPPPGAFAERGQAGPASGGGDTFFRTRVASRVQIIVRDEDGTVKNGPALGRIFWDSSIEEIPFTREEDVFAYRLADGSHYRSLIFQQHNAVGKVHYIQLVANADGEQGIIDSFLSILVLCVAGFILLSITASFFLANRSMQPLMRAWQRQSEFVENASHELRTPLTIIQNKLEGLLREPQATVIEKADNIALSLSETRRLSSLTSDLMTLARADSDQTQIQKESFSIDALIAKVCEPYAELAVMQEKTWELKLHFDGEITADKSRIHELMVILLDNALKYTRAGDMIQVSTAARENKLEITVSDTGIGMSEEARSRAFDRFYREDKARSRANGGSGLGLSIAKWIVDVHHGAIRILPNKPSGTALEVRIPK